MSWMDIFYMKYEFNFFYWSSWNENIQPEITCFDPGFCCCCMEQCAQSLREVCIQGHFITDRNTADTKCSVDKTLPVRRPGGSNCTQSSKGQINTWKKHIYSQMLDRKSPSSLFFMVFSSTQSMCINNME